jgi:hypothetical protein
MASERPDRGPTDQGYKVFEWINRHAWLLAGVLVLAGVAFAGLFVAVADDGEPAFDPGGEIYDTADRVEEVFASSSSTQVDVFIVEHPDGGDVLTRDSLLELKNNQDELLADSESQQHLTTSFDSDLGIEIVGVFSIADVVDDALPAGLEGATDGEVKAALSELLADGAPTASLRFLLSTTQTTREPGSIDGEDIVVWESPAFFARVVYDIDTFDPAQLSDSFDDETNLDAERGAERRLRSLHLRGRCLHPDLRGRSASLVLGSDGRRCRPWRGDDGLQRLQRLPRVEDRIAAADSRRAHCSHQLRRRLLHPRERPSP